MIKNYYQPTPKKLRKIGDAILLSTASISAMMMGAPLSENAKTWCIFILNVIGVAGKVITNLFKEEGEVEPNLANPPSQN